jgi:hypothetical protein
MDMDPTRAGVEVIGRLPYRPSRALKQALAVAGVTALAAIVLAHGTPVAIVGYAVFFIVIGTVFHLVYRQRDRRELEAILNGPPGYATSVTVHVTRYRCPTGPRSARLAPVDILECWPVGMEPTGPAPVAVGVLPVVVEALGGQTTRRVIGVRGRLEPNAWVVFELPGRLIIPATRLTTGKHLRRYCRPDRPTPAHSG